jgi:hypothetical protein
MLDKTKGFVPADETERVTITPPNFQQARVTIVGNAPYVQNKMSRRAFETMRAAQAEGSRSKNRKNRAPKDFDGRFRETIHISREGWMGIPCSSVRNALISACRVSGFPMTRARMSIFVVPDGFDAEDGQPLIKIKGEPRPLEMAVRLATGVTDIAVRPIWDEWSAVLTLKWDGDQFGVQDVVNLVSRAGIQVGIGSGRPDSKTSNGMGWGTWDIKQ